MEPQPFDCGNGKVGHHVASGPGASMEPQPFDCGNMGTGSVSIRDITRLQWSRSLSTAEIRRPCRHRGGRVQLQWSRSLSTAEMAESELTAWRATHASMEPQPFDCGNAATGHMVQIWCAKLQWSRSLSTAEIRIQHSGARCSARASMEPQPFDCGNTNYSRPARRGSCCFNGAAAFRLRKFQACE